MAEMTKMTIEADSLDHFRLVSGTYTCATIHACTGRFHVRQKKPTVEEFHQSL